MSINNLIRNKYIHLREILRKPQIKKEEYIKTLNLIKKYEYEDRSIIENLRFELFKELYINAITNIPFYKKWYSDFGLNKNSIKTPEDIKKIPILNKEIVRKNNMDFFYNPNNDKLHYHRTGGSTGQPLILTSNRDSILIEWAFIHKIWSRIGYIPGDLCIAFRRSEYYYRKDGINQWHDRVNNFIYLSIYDMDKKVALKYLKTIVLKKPKFLYGYPSSIYLLAQLILDKKIDFNFNLKGILCGSEKLYDWQRKIIKQAFGCRVFTWYGMAEKVILAAECEHDEKRYHVEPLYGNIEIVDTSDNVITTPNTHGSIIGTGFQNNLMPLIRYNTEDITSYSPKQECSCGRNSIIINQIEGRKQQYLYFSDGSLLTVNGSYPVLALIGQYSTRYKIVQTKLGEIDLIIVPKKNNPKDFKKIIIHKIKQKLAKKLNVNIIEVDNISPDKNGKFLFLEQKVNLK